MPSVEELQVEKEEVDLDMSDQLEDMIRGVRYDSFQPAHMYDNTCNDTEKPLYKECIKYTQLSVV